MKKKAQIEQIGALIVPLVAIGIVLAVGFLIIAQIKTQAIETADTFTISSDFTYTTNTSVVLNDSCINDEDLVVIVALNGTGTGEDVVLNPGNYTVIGKTINVSDCCINGTANGIATLGSTIEINYSCKRGTAAINGTKETLGALDDIPGWLPIIVITIIGAILIGLVGIFRRQQ